MARSWQPGEDVFIDESLTILRGEKARQRLLRQNESAYLDPAGGITSVPVERWQEAQRCEYQHWFQSERKKADDRNYQHLTEFDHYQALEGRSFSRAIELGCGPFTNLRLVGRVCSIKSCDLLDPLLKYYLSHRNRFMETAFLATAPLQPAFSRVFKLAPGTFRRVARIMGGTIPVSQLLSVSIEQMPASSGPYDLIVMINVLEHCLSVDRVFDRIESISAPGSILVFADRGYDREEVRDLSRHVYDAAHPLRVPADLFEEKLAPFECLYSRRRAAGEAPYCLAEDIYYIGRRRS